MNHMRTLLLLPLPLLALSACSFGNDPRMSSAKAPSAPAILSASGESASTGIAALARKALSLGETEAALPLARQAVAADPEDAAARQLLAEVLLASGVANEAEAEFAALLQKSPADPALKTGHAMALLAMGDAASARQELVTVVAAKPSLPILSNAALALALAGDPKAAADALAPVAFAPGATAQLRQNYALALTLSGSRSAAYEVASHDLGPQQALAQVNGWYAQMDKPLAQQLLALTGLPSQPGAVRQVLAMAVPAPSTVTAEPVPAPLPKSEAADLATSVQADQPAPLALVPLVSNEPVVAEQSRLPAVAPGAVPSVALAAQQDAPDKESLPKLDIVPITRDNAMSAQPKAETTKPMAPLVIIPARSGKLLTTTVSMANGQSATAAPKIATTGKWMVQIAAVNQKLQPSLLSRRLKQQFGALIESLGPVFTRLAAVNNKPVKRVFFGPYETREAAKAACTKVRAQGNGCIIKTQPTMTSAPQTGI
jgi:Flp pilus assembly protein TadD